jgi:2-iminobutanoate/2-iminopropanoate deaminase
LERALPFISRRENAYLISSPLPLSACGEGWLKAGVRRILKRTMKPKIITTPNAPAPIGPYSQAIVADNLIFISGQIPLDPQTGTVVGTTIQEQAKQALNNLKAILVSQSLDTSALVKTTVFIRSMTDFPAFNAIYEEEFGGWKPARSVVEVSGLPKNVLVEIEAVACR